MDTLELYNSVRPRYPELAGQVAIVTGSSKGIGKGIAIRLVKEGMKVVINARHAEDPRRGRWPDDRHGEAAGRPGRRRDQADAARIRPVVRAGRQSRPGDDARPDPHRRLGSRAQGRHAISARIRRPVAGRAARVEASQRTLDAEKRYDDKLGVLDVGQMARLTVDVRQREGIDRAAE